MRDEAIRTEIPVDRELAEYLERHISAFEQVIAKAMALKVIYGLGTKQAVREAMREVPA